MSVGILRILPPSSDDRDVGATGLWVARWLAVNGLGGTK